MTRRQGRLGRGRPLPVSGSLHEKPVFSERVVETTSVECYDKTSPETRRNPNCGLHRNDAASVSDASQGPSAEHRGHHREEDSMDMNPDVDPQETQEWLDSIDGVLEHEGPDRAHFLIEQVIDKSRRPGGHTQF